MRVTRNERDFHVYDAPSTNSWNFWSHQFASGNWEPDTLKTIEKTLTPESLYLDVGAWVGPTVLWANTLCKRIIAVEPDPIAFETLSLNVEQNASIGESVRLIEGALIPDDGESLETVSLHSQSEGWGNSMSTLLDRGNGEIVPVAAWTLSSILMGEDIDNLDLVKIDIEGGEAVVFPDIADQLYDLGAKVLLSLHLPWITDSTALMQAIENYGEVEHLSGGGSGGFGSVLLTPR